MPSHHGTEQARDGRDLNNDVPPKASDTDPSSGSEKLCNDAACRPEPPPPTTGNLHEMFPGLQVRPRPEPEPAMKDEHDAWSQEYEQWGKIRCPCGRGYFCRDHGSWISGNEVGSGTAASWDQQKQGSCPGHHYGDNSGVES